MGWNRRTQLIVLAAGLLAWGGAIYWRLTQPAPPPAAATDERRSGTASVQAKSEPRPAGAEARTAARREPAKPAALPALRLDLLDRPLPPLAPEGKNLFASLLPPPAPPPKAAPAGPPPPPPPDPFLEEARKLRVVAIMQEDGQNVAFIADANEVYSVKKNDVIRSQFLIKDLNEDGVVVSLPNGEKEVRLALVPAGGAGPPR